MSEQVCIDDKLSSDDNILSLQGSKWRITMRSVPIESTLLLFLLF